MPSFHAIYRQHAADYDRLVRREDYQGNLLAALHAICPLAGCTAADLGTGTGRVARLLAPFARAVYACDASHHMLSEAARQLARRGLHNTVLAAARHAALPLPTACADLALEGWSFGHATGWYPDAWRERIGAMLAEMARIVRPGGWLVVIETLGTGVEIPAAPTPGLAAFYQWLESERGFQSTWVRTDYRFESPAEAERLTRFFFGDELAERVARQRLAVIPECTGVWYRRA